jgi:3-oxoacyl-[acyl-carrier-protein] synthase II
MTPISVLDVGLLSPVGGPAELARLYPETGGAAPEALPTKISPHMLPVSGPQFRRTPRLARLALAALAALAPRPGDPSQALVLATAHGSTAANFEFLDSVLRDGPNLASPTAFAHSVTNMPAALVGRHLNLVGPALTITNQTLTPAFEAAACLLAARLVETVLLGAAAEISTLMNEVERLSGRTVSIPIEGAVFLRLGRADDSSRAPRLISGLTDGTETSLVSWPTLGQGPLASAFRVALAFQHLQTSGLPLVRLRFPGEDFTLEGGGNDQT